MMGHMAVILDKDLKRGHDALARWCADARRLAEGDASHGAGGQARLSLAPTLPRPVWAMAVRYSLFLLERRAPGPGVEVRVAPWGAVKILDGPESDPHNLTPPDVIELEPEVWLRLACGITTWAEEKDAGHISAVGERDDLSDLLPL
ncbi:sterol carrier family protein [Bifidobacterium longum]|uniref:sterol carrier family protein n=1 Tax=Bifidobacterium longum TaxID=216816 RepID=UPI003877F1CF